MIATHSVKTLNKVISVVTSCDSSKCLKCINFYQKVWSLSNSNTEKIITRNLCMNKSELQETKDSYFDKNDEFGNLKVPLEKTLTAKCNLHPSSLSKAEITDSSELCLKTVQTEISQNQQMELWSDSEGDSDDDASGDDETVYFEKKHAKQYLQEMKLLDKQKNLKEALALYSEMKQNKIFPKKYIYTFLIGACGRAGYTKAAFKLFKEMRDRHMTPSSATLTGLFNSCAESPFPKNGLEKAHELRNRMIENGWLPSTITYHSMIKAFGKCGDLKTAFQIVDEMAGNKYCLTSETFSFLLMSCISDKEAGFTHAVQVFRKMRKLRIGYSKYHYNLLLRAVRECGIGPPEISSQLLFDWNFHSKQKKFQYVAAENIPLQISETLDKRDKYSEDPVKYELHNDKTSESSDADKVAICLKKDVQNKLILHRNSAPSLLETYSPANNKVIGLENIHTANDRLLLLGGADGLLSSMTSEKIKPDIKTITLLLDCIPPTYDAEQMLIGAVMKYNIKPDIDFFNIIIKRRNIRNEYTAALEILKILPQHGVNVDIATYGVLALGCEKRKFGNKLLSDMKDAGVQPNIEIIGALVSNASARKDFRYLIDMMNITKKLGIKPDPIMLKDLEKARQKADRLLSEKDSKYVKPETLKWCRIFCLQYKPWLQSINIEVPQHPWKQFRMSNNKIL